MALSFPRDLICDLWLGRWVNIAGAVRQDPPPTIERGRRGEHGTVPPSLLSLVLKNGADLPAPFNAGDFTPGNPAGQFHGLLGRNTPIRYGLYAAKDTFTRTVSNGWGTSNTSDPWSNIGAASDISTDGSVGKHSVPATDAFRATYMAGLVVRDCRVQVAFTLTFTDVTGGNVEPANILLRGKVGSTTDYYFIRCVITTAEAITLEIRHVSAAAGETVLAGPVTVSGIIHASGQSVTVAGEIEGSTIRCKAWLTSGSEPFGWQLSTVDTQSRLSAAGWVGVRSGVASGNTNTLPIVFSYDNFQVWLTRFFGETASIKPRWDETHRYKWVEIEAAGVLRRLEQRRGPIITAPERYFTTVSPAPIAYWPFDDGELANTGRVFGQGNPGEAFSYNGSWVPGRAFGNGDLAVWLPDCVNIKFGAFVRGRLIEPGIAGNPGWTAHFATRFDGRYTDTLSEETVMAGELVGGTFEVWRLHFLSFDTEIQVARPDTGAVIATVSVPQLYDEAVHHVGLRTTQVGADVAWVLMVDGATVGSGTATAQTNPALKRLSFQQSAIGSDDSRSRSFGHLAMFSGNGPTPADVHSAIMGLPGERAGRRIERIAGDNEIAFDYLGNLDDTASLGPQAALPLLDSLRECGEAELGTVGESRSVSGLMLRPLTSLYNQAHILVLDYSAGHLAGPLQPEDDDRNTVNHVVAKRKDGGEDSFVQETGSLNVGDPGADSDAVGRYQERVTVNVEADDQLLDIASMLVHIGTVADDRYPRIRVNLRNPSVDAVTQLEVLDVNIDDRFAIDNLTAVHIPGSIDQLARGYTEILSTFQHEVIFNAAPSSPYLVFILDSDRLDSDATTLNGNLTTSATSVPVAISDGALWTTDAGEMPFDIEIGGEVMRVTAVSGSSSPQTFTVTRAINGIAGTHSTGDKVRLASDAALALR